MQLIRGAKRYQTNSVIYTYGLTNHDFRLLTYIVSCTEMEVS
jgi:hypothetical protein